MSGDMAAGRQPDDASAATTKSARRRSVPKMALVFGVAGVLVAALILLFVRLVPERTTEITELTLASPSGTALVVSSTETPRQQRQYRAGIASFANCPNRAAELQS